MPLVLLALCFAAFLFWRPGQRRVRRLEQLIAESPTHQLLAPSAESRPDLQRFLPHRLVRNLRLVNLEPDWKDAGVCVAAVALPLIVIGLFLGIFAALALALAIPVAAYAVLNVMAARRVRELGSLMPGFFERIRQLLAVGNSLPTAFARAVHGAQPRLVQVFAPALRRMGNGASFSESIRQSADDIGLYEIRLFATAVTTNMRFGGSLSHSLANLAAYLRKRASIERELRANTAQIRASAWVLGLLPMAVASLIVFQNPDYARWFLVHPTGRVMLIYCIVSQIAGTFVMRMIVRTGF